MKSLLSNPFRIIIMAAVLAAVGLLAVIKLPVSLYPQTSRPVVGVSINYAGYSAKEFIRKYGATIEYQLENIKNTGLPLDNVEATYNPTGATYRITFDWRVPFDRAQKEVEAVTSGMKGILPKESGDSLSVWQWGDNAGFLAVSFFSTRHSLTELHDLLDPVITPELRKIQDAKEAVLWNPESQEISIKLAPDKLVSYGLLPGDVFRRIEAAIPSLTGGELKLGQKKANLQIPSSLTGLDTLEQLSVPLPGDQAGFVFLKDIAAVSVGRSENNSRSFKTNGKESLMLFAEPKSGANVKRMAEEIMESVERLKTKFPEGVEYRVLVDPSEFIRNSIQNLFKDVAIAALLAVFVLFLFIGSLKNVVTAAIEIPLSMIISFIAMYFADMNLNLISLGGLALAAGMNVDASVVVMENIFRKQEEWGRYNEGRPGAAARFHLIYSAVREVAAPVILSICTTLIVFIPLALTTDLTNAILGDLAKAVVFSHGVSGFVALLLVPCIRILIIKDLKPQGRAPLDKVMRVLELRYLRVLESALKFRWGKPLALGAPFLLAVILCWAIIPRLPKEIIGSPDSDWIYISVFASQSNSNRQLENLLQEVESRALSEEGSGVLYTFVQLGGKQGGSVMLRLKDKKRMKETVKRLQASFSNTPDTYFTVDSWNPSELPLPRMYHIELKAFGKNPEELLKAASRINYFMREQGDYDRLEITPGGLNEKLYVFGPHRTVWSALAQGGETLSFNDVLDLSVYANFGKRPGSMNVAGKLVPVNIRFQDDTYQNPEALAAYPLKLQGKLVPLSALGSFDVQPGATQIFRGDGREQARIRGRLDKDRENEWEPTLEKYRKLLAEQGQSLTGGGDVTLEILPPQKELIESLEQIKSSLLTSLLLIFLILWLQFQSAKLVGIIMVTIPLGIIGALPPLYFFGSTLSLNSALGILLLNGISVNNSILLVDVTVQLMHKGLSSFDAIREACRSRLRPILITSLTTSLGMLPIALGLGDGGKILQPLGITVAFGLFFSTTMALFIVPVLLKGIRVTRTLEKVDDPKELLLLQLKQERSTEDRVPQ